MLSGIEHLETCSPDDAKRLGKLGITASVQAVHSEPAGLTAWPTLLGSERCKTVFPYKAFADHGSILALGTDAPTAPHLPLPNMYIASTRRSPRNDSVDPTTPQFALSLAASVSATTLGAAYSCFTDKWAGKIEPGFVANLTVVEMEWEAKKLLEAKVVETWSNGKSIWKRRI
jgi:predicted amidohydrolase YtcJ